MCYNVGMESFKQRCEREDEEDRLSLLPTEPMPDKLTLVMDLLMDLKHEGRIKEWHIGFGERGETV